MSKIMSEAEAQEIGFAISGYFWHGYSWMRKDAALRIIRHVWFKRDGHNPEVVYFTNEQNWEQFKDDLDMKGEDYFRELK